MNKSEKKCSKLQTDLDELKEQFAKDRMNKFTQVDQIAYEKRENDYKTKIHKLENDQVKMTSKMTDMKKEILDVKKTNTNLEAMIDELIEPRIEDLKKPNGNTDYNNNDFIKHSKIDEMNTIVSDLQAFKGLISKLGESWNSINLSSSKQTCDLCDINSQKLKKLNSCKQEFCESCYSDEKCQVCPVFNNQYSKVNKKWQSGRQIKRGVHEK